MSSQSEDSPLDSIKRFYHLQAERVETYALFEEGFQAYLKGAPNYNFTMYKQLVHEITTTFQKISSDILDIEQMFVINGRQELADSIRKIQNLEEKKLKSTAELQMIRQRQTDEPNTDLREPISELSEKLTEAVEAINDEMETLKYNSEDLYGGGDT